MKEITVFSYGDSRSLATWSNVPYFFTTSIEEKGITVNRINVRPSRFLIRLWNGIFLRALRLILPKTTFTFDRTPLFRWLTDLKMKRAVRMYPKTDCFISISFSYHPKKYTKKPVIMFCDWTYDYYFDHFLNRKPDVFEKQEIRNQERMQRSVDAMVVLFPDVADYIKSKYHNSNVYYLGNVVNSENIPFGSIDTLKKFNNNNIVFIGSKKYLKGLLALLRALNFVEPAKVNNVYVIGMVESDIPIELRNEKVHFLGYLDKTNSNQHNEYYQAIGSSKIFVNTTPEWAAFSATLDCMYRGTPVITSKYRSFTNTFGDNIDFGEYSSNTPEEIAKHISSIFRLTKSEYVALCSNARKSVEPFGWDNYTNKVLKIADRR